MHKALRSILLFSAILITVILVFPKPTYADPGLSTTFTSRPTAHDAHAGVDDPTYAYDNNLANYARIAYDKSEYEEVKTFSTTGAPTTEEIAFVDFKMKYTSAAGGSGENYRIIYYVGTAGPVILQNWIGDGQAFDYSSVRVWFTQSEPNDGVWNWTDINNIRFRVEGGTGGGGAAYFYEYEAWVEVYSYRKATMAVDPASLTDPSSPFTVDINVTNVDDLYGWEFKLYYLTSILTATGVTEGPFLNQSGAKSSNFFVIQLTDAFNATHGRVWTTCTLIGGATLGTTGSGDLATVTFTVDGTSGTTPLDLVDTKLVGYDQPRTRLAQMRHNHTDGSVTISAVPEFPLGATLEIALLVAIVYVWLRRRKKPKESISNTVLLSKQT